MKNSTHIAFAIPVGEAVLPTSLCDQFGDVDTEVPQVFDETNGVPDINFLDKYVEAKDTITHLFASFAETLYGYRQDWRITSSWLTSNLEGDLMYRHNHKNCIYSGVLYPFTYDKEHAPLIIENPLNDLSNFIINTPKPSVFFSDYIGRHPIPRGHMIFFPSYLYHYHASFKKTDTPRKSVAFNFFPNEDFGVNDSKFTVRPA